jgi:hypothetical protein
MDFRLSAISLQMNEFPTPDFTRCRCAPEHPVVLAQFAKTGAKQGHEKGNVTRMLGSRSRKLLKRLAAQAGFEPATLRLTAEPQPFIQHGCKSLRTLESRCPAERETEGSGIVARIDANGFRTPHLRTIPELSWRLHPLVQSAPRPSLAPGVFEDAPCEAI